MGFTINLFLSNFKFIFLLKILNSIANSKEKWKIDLGNSIYITP